MWGKRASGSTRQRETESGYSSRNVMTDRCSHWKCPFLMRGNERGDGRQEVDGLIDVFDLQLLTASFMPANGNYTNSEHEFRQCRAERDICPPTKHSSNSNLPVLHYPQALSDKTLEGSLAAIEPKGWFKGGHWKIADVPEAATPHYHSTTHEFYTALKGKGVYCLGKSPLDSNDEGFSFVGEGDVFAFPVHNTTHV